MGVAAASASRWPRCPHVKCGHLNQNGHLNTADEDIKMATPEDSVDTTNIKVATADTQGKGHVIEPRFW